MHHSSDLQETLEKMEEKRAELQEFALSNGFDHPTTIQLSQELDELFNYFFLLNSTHK